MEVFVLINYYDNIIKKGKVKTEGFDQVILKKGDVYYTPPLTTGILRGFVIENYNVV